MEVVSLLPHADEPAAPEDGGGAKLGNGGAPQSAQVTEIRAAGGGLASELMHSNRAAPWRSLCFTRHFFSWRCIKSICLTDLWHMEEEMLNLAQCLFKIHLPLHFLWTEFHYFECFQLPLFILMFGKLWSLCNLCFPSKTAQSCPVWRVDSRSVLFTWKCLSLAVSPYFWKQTFSFWCHCVNQH